MRTADEVTLGEWHAFIGGTRRPATTRASFEVLTPATGGALARVASCGPEDVHSAVGAARDAFESDWRHRPPRERAALLRAIGERIRDHAEELADLECREVGKPVRDALRFDVTFAHVTFGYFAGLAESLAGRLLHQGPIDTRVVYEPYGVVGAILPFNWPPIHFATKCAAALAAGNTLVVKPGDQAPLTVLRLVELASEVLPAGVINAVPGPDAGPALAAHPGVGRLTFTGSPETGRRVMAAAARNLTPSTMELGGKNALIVLDDADLDLALQAALEGMYFNQGEACTSTSRLLVHDSLHDEFLERFGEATARLVLGDGLEATTDLGPLIDAAHRDRVLEYIEVGRQEGARVAAQGHLPGDARLHDGFFVAPLVFADVRPDMRIAQEEIFGPVACVLRFDDDDEAIQIANGTRYGLTAAVFSRDAARAERIANRMEAGMVFVNNYHRASLLGSPFGGIKDSGFGREGAPETLHEFLRAKNLRFATDRPVPVWETAERVLA